MRTETIIFWLPLAAIVAHIFEEFVWPGGFAAWYRGYRPEIASSIRPKFLFWVNAALVFAGLSVGFDGPSWIGPPFFIALTTLLAANALFHLRAVLKTRIYSPGVVTGVLLYIPLALFGYWYMPQARHTSLLTVLIATALGSTYQLFSLANHRRRAAQASTRGTGHKRSAGEPPAVDPAAKLAEGCKILGSVLLPHGFHFELREVGKSSGGYFAWGEYVKGDRRLEIHFRYSPGHITYHFGDRSISHEAYMWSALGKAGGNRYPGFSDDPMRHFRDLAFDLENYARGFVRGTDDELSRRFDDAVGNPRPMGFARIFESEDDGE